MAEEIALRQVLRFSARNAPAVVEVAAVRRPEVVLRRTRYGGIVVDERVLTRSFPWVEHRPSLQALVPLDGAVRLGALGEAPGIALRAGDVLLLRPVDASRARFEDATFVDLEWDADPAAAGPLPRRVGTVDSGRAARLGERLGAGDAPDRELFAEAFDLFGAAGAPLGEVRADTLAGGPSDRDLRVARAVAGQLADLRSAATTSLGDLADLSPRQLQRVLAEVSARYRINATNWRDMRNRYRLQVAVALLSVPSLSVAEIADEVGYASAAALARALANAGMPSPSELREEIERMASVP